MKERNSLLKVYAVDDSGTYRTFFLERKGVDDLIKHVNTYREQDIEIGSIYIEAKLPNGEKVTMVCDIWVDAKDLIQKPNQNSTNY